MILVSALLLLAAGPNAAGEAQFKQAQAVSRSFPLRARTLYERAARQGHAGAQASLGLLLFQEGNRTAALRWIKAAADQGEPRGLLLYGTALFNGDGVLLNRGLGYSLVARAAALGLPEAENTRSEMDLVMSEGERRLAAKLLEPLAPTPAATTEPDAATATADTKKGKSASAGSRKPRRVAARPAAPQRAAAIRPAASQPRVVKLAQAAPATGGGWRIQLGAFRANGAAQALFARVSPTLAGKRPTYLPLGSMTRLLVGPYPSQASAQAACRSLGPRQPCFPIAAR